MYILSVEGKCNEGWLSSKEVRHMREPGLLSEKEKILICNAVSEQLKEKHSLNCGCCELIQINLLDSSVCVAKN